MSPNRLLAISVGFGAVTGLLVIWGLGTLYRHRGGAPCIAGETFGTVIGLRGIALLVVAMISGLFSTCFALMAFMRRFMNEFQATDET
jgi:hypothetical protein